MRSLPLHDGTIQIASVAGETRRIKVSGLARARLLWLFRNFTMLDFSVLTRNQQELIARVWNAGASAKDAADVIGIVEGFSPKLFPSPSPAPAASAPRAESAQPPARVAPPAGLRAPTILAALSVILLAAALYLGPGYLAPSRAWVPQRPAAAIADAAGARTSPVVASPAKESSPPRATQQISAKPSPMIAARPAPTARPASVPVVRAAAPPPAPVHAPAPVHPEAMAQEATPSELTRQRG
jgi:hypothetical protein